MTDGGEKDLLQRAVEDKEIPHIYFNGFSTTIGTGDVVVSLLLNGQPITVLNTSYTVAKTLVEKLGAAVDTLEKVSGNTIMTTDDVTKAFKKLGEAGDNANS